MKTYKVSEELKRELDWFKHYERSGEVCPFLARLDDLMHKPVYQELRKEINELAKKEEISGMWANEVLFVVDHYLSKSFKVEVNKPKYHVILIDNGEDCPSDIYRYVLLTRASNGNRLKVEYIDGLGYFGQWDYEDIPDKYKPFAGEV